MFWSERHYINKCSISFFIYLTIFVLGFDLWKMQWLDSSACSTSIWTWMKIYGNYYVLRKKIYLIEPLLMSGKDEFSHLLLCLVLVMLASLFNFWFMTLPLFKQRQWVGYFQDLGHSRFYRNTTNVSLFKRYLISKWLLIPYFSLLQAILCRIILQYLSPVPAGL